MNRTIFDMIPIGVNDSCGIFVYEDLATSDLEMRSPDSSRHNEIMRVDGV